MSYIIICAVFKGQKAVMFDPDILLQVIWRCIFLQLAESSLILACLQYLLQTSHCPFLDVLAYSGYKYVGICIAVSTQCFDVSSALSLVASLYFGICYAYFLLKVGLILFTSRFQ